MKKHNLQEQEQQRQVWCSICGKGPFTNRKSMGGHLRSHYAALPLPPKSETPTPRHEQQLQPRGVEEKSDPKPFSLVSIKRERTSCCCVNREESGADFEGIRCRCDGFVDSEEDPNVKSRSLIESSNNRSHDSPVRYRQNGATRPNLDEKRDVRDGFRDLKQNPSLKSTSLVNYNDNGTRTRPDSARKLKLARKRDSDFVEGSTGSSSKRWDSDDDDGRRRLTKSRERFAVGENEVGRSSSIAKPSNDDIDGLSEYLGAVLGLIKLKTDTRFRGVSNRQERKKYVYESEEDNEKEEEVAEEEEEELEEGEFRVSPYPKPKEKKLRYTCEICNKGFATKQAKGGHIASHKRHNTYKLTTSTHVVSQSKEGKTGPSSSGGGMAMHECPYCDKTFKSGHALGGHKRVHFATPSSTAASDQSVVVVSDHTVDKDSPGTSTPIVKSNNLWIDLNLPANENER